MTQSTNEMLRGLDKVRKQNNVIFICTSNFISNIDAAFVDRCFLEEFIDAPAVDCVYDILRSELNKLIKQDLVHSHTMVYEGYAGQSGSSAVVYTQTGLIPSMNWASIHWGGARRTAVSELYRIAELAKGLSGRKLGDVVSQAQYKYTAEGRCDLEEMLCALERAIRQKTGRSRPSTQASSEADGADMEDAAKCGIMEFVSRLKTVGDSSHV
jgi:AAA+ superfamily predicted ATPase